MDSVYFCTAIAEKGAMFSRGEHYKCSQDEINEKKQVSSFIIATMPQNLLGHEPATDPSPPVSQSKPRSEDDVESDKEGNPVDDVGKKRKELQNPQDMTSGLDQHSKNLKVPLSGCKPEFRSAVEKVAEQDAAHQRLQLKEKTPDDVEGLISAMEKSLPLEISRLAVCLLRIVSRSHVSAPDNCCSRTSR